MKYPLWRTYLIVDTFGIRLDNQTRDPQCVHLGQKSAYNASMLGRLMRPMATINVNLLDCRVVAVFVIDTR